MIWFNNLLISLIKWQKSLFVFTFNFLQSDVLAVSLHVSLCFLFFWFFCLVNYFLSLSSVSLYFLSLFCVFVPCLPLSFSRCSHLCIFSISLFFFLFSIYLFCLSVFLYLLSRTWTVRVIAIQIKSYHFDFGQLYYNRVKFVFLLLFLDLFHRCKSLQKMLNSPLLFRDCNILKKCLNGFKIT